MPLLTTTIGAFPKPDYVPIIDWFKAEGGLDTEDPTGLYEAEIERMGDEAEQIFQRAARDVIADQEKVMPQMAIQISMLARATPKKMPKPAPIMAIISMVISTVAIIINIRMVNKIAKRKRRG